MSSQADYLKRYGSAAAKKDSEKGLEEKKRRRKKVKPAPAGWRIVDEDAPDIGRHRDRALVDAAWERDNSDGETPTLVETAAELAAAHLVQRGSWAAVDENGNAMTTAAAQEDASPPRRRRVASTASDASPPRRKQRHDSPDASPPRRRAAQPAADEDASPPRRRQRHDSSDADPSPPRRRRHDSPDTATAAADASPPRRRRQLHDSPDGAIAAAAAVAVPVEQQDDASPPRRRQRHDSSSSSPPRRRRRRHDSDDSGATAGARSTAAAAAAAAGDGAAAGVKTASGYSAGLQSGADFKKVEQEMKARHEQELKGMSAASGQNAETVYRDKKGRKLDMLNEMMRQEAIRAGKQVAAKEAEYGWGLGAVQKQDEAKHKAEIENIKLQPFARTVDHLDAELKEVMRPDDPMAAYMAKKVAKQVVAAGGKPPKPVYKGPAPKPNRFGIKPGYRWDGVDRGTGWEQKLADAHTAKKHKSTVDYQYSTADM